MAKVCILFLIINIKCVMIIVMTAKVVKQFVVRRRPLGQKGKNMEEKVFFQLNPVEFGSVFPYINDGLYPYRYALDINTVLCDWQNENYMSTARWVVRVVSGGYEVEDKKEGGKKVYRTGEALAAFFNGFYHTH